MGFEPGHKYGTGRPKGSVNKATADFKRVLEDKGFNVAEALLEIYTKSMEIAKNADEKDVFTKLNSMKLAGDMAKEIASYSTPKLKSVEHFDGNALSGMSPHQKLEAMKEAVTKMEEMLSKEAKQIESK